jgi:hypothetical protein
VIQREIPESWSSTSLAKKRCQKHRQDTFVLDTAFTLIEGHPLYRNGKEKHRKGWATRQNQRQRYAVRAFVLPTSRKGREKWGTPFFELSVSLLGDDGEIEKTGPAAGGLRSVDQDRAILLLLANSRFLRFAVAPASVGMTKSLGRVCSCCGRNDRSFDDCGSGFGRNDRVWSE